MLVVLTSENSYTSCKKQEHFFLPSVHWCRKWSNVSERWGMFWTMFHVVFIRANIKALTCMVNLIFFFFDFSNSLMRVIIETSCQWPEALRLSSKLSLCLSHSLSLSPSVSLPLFWSFPVVLCLSPSYKCVHFSIHNSVHHMVDNQIWTKCFIWKFWMSVATVCFFVCFLIRQCLNLCFKSLFFFFFVTNYMTNYIQKFGFSQII